MATPINTEADVEVEGRGEVEGSDEGRGSTEAAAKAQQPRAIAHKPMAMPRPMLLHEPKPMAAHKPRSMLQYRCCAANAESPRSQPTPRPAVVLLRDAETDSAAKFEGDGA